MYGRNRGWAHTENAKKTRKTLKSLLFSLVDTESSSPHTYAKYKYQLRWWAVTSHHITTSRGFRLRVGKGNSDWGSTKILIGGDEQPFFSRRADSRMAKVNSNKQVNRRLPLSPPPSGSPKIHLSLFEFSGAHSVLKRNRLHQHRIVETDDRRIYSSMHDTQLIADIYI